MWKFFTFGVFYIDVKWLNIIHVVCPLMLRKTKMCWVTQHQCRSRQNGKYSQIYTYFLSFTNKWLVLPEQSIHGKFNSLVCPLQLRTNYIWVVSVRQMWKIFTNSPRALTFVYYDSSRLNNLFMVSFQHIRMSSYAKNKQQMCWVTQHQCRSRQMWKIFTNSPRHSLFVCYKKWLVLAWTIYSW